MCHEREIMCHEKPHTLGIKFLIKKCSLPWMESAPAVAICQLFSALYKNCQCCCGSISLGMLSQDVPHMADYQSHCRSHGLLGVGLSWCTENKTILCFNRQDWNSRPCLLFTGSAFLCCMWKHSRKVTAFSRVPTFAWCDFTNRWKLTCLELFLPMTVALLSSISRYRNNPPCADFKFFYFKIMLSL